MFQQRKKLNGETKQIREIGHITWLYFIYILRKISVLKHMQYEKKYQTENILPEIVSNTKSVFHM